MKKHFLLLLTIMLGAVGTAWGQASEFVEYYVKYTVNNPVYNGEAQQGVFIEEDNCGDAETINGDKTATNAGSYTAQIASHCSGHQVITGSGAYTSFITFFHQPVVSVGWSILPRPLTDADVVIETQDITWNGNHQDISTAVKSIKYKTNDLTLGTDYKLFVINGSDEGKVRNEGRYTLVFEGIGNFEGVITKTFDVKKNLSQDEATNGIHYVIPEQILKIKDDHSGYNALEKFEIEVTDTKSHVTLYEGDTKDYTLTFFDDETNAETFRAADPAAEDASTAINITEVAAEGKFWVVVKGVAPKYDAKTKKEFYVVKEYQTQAAADVDGNSCPAVSMRITKAGYPNYAPVGTTAPVKGEVKVAQTPIADSKFDPCIAATENRCNIENELSVDVSSDALKFDVVGITGNAFVGCNDLRWIDSNIPAETWTPNSLDREAFGAPFCGVPKQAVVYLFGYSIVGTNYVYKMGGSDKRCAQYRLYEDLSGTQTKFE